MLISCSLLPLLLVYLKFRFNTWVVHTWGVWFFNRILCPHPESQSVKIWVFLPIAMTRAFVVWLDSEHGDTVFSSSGHHPLVVFYPSPSTYYSPRSFELWTGCQLSGYESFRLGFNCCFSPFYLFSLPRIVLSFSYSGANFSI